MSDTLTAVDINCTTGEVTERPLTAEEIAEREVAAAQSAERETAKAAAATALAALKASAKAKLVTGTPLTEEEAAVIVL
jgi:hypothetical protein